VKCNACNKYNNNNIIYNSQCNDIQCWLLLLMTNDKYNVYNILLLILMIYYYILIIINIIIIIIILSTMYSIYWQCLIIVFYTFNVSINKYN